MMCAAGEAAFFTSAVSAFAVVLQFIYMVFKINGRLSTCETDIKWLKDFLIFRNVNSDLIEHHSPIQSKIKLKKGWIDKIKYYHWEREDRLENLITQIPQRLTYPILKDWSKKHNLPLEDFLLHTALYIRAHNYFEDESNF